MAASAPATRRPFFSVPLPTPGSDGSTDDEDEGSQPANGSANGHAAQGQERAQMPAYRPPQDPSLLPDGRHPLSGISLRAFLLGLALGTSGLATAVAAWSGSALWRTPFFLACLATFHFLEFWVTAAYNTPLATPSAFLLSANGSAYMVAHVSAFAETTVTHAFGWLAYPQLLPRWVNGVWLAAGFAALLAGQAARSLAMIQCGRNFNHTVQTYRRQEHELVTAGIYSVLRHPSYFGFFWWALGTQVVLGNWLCLAAYAVVLWGFFSSRIRKEEALLIRFFGKEYEEYRQRTGVGIPFVR